MPNNLPSINLAKEEISPFDKFINWTLTIGRIIVIITEIVAVSAFIYRFSLDERLVSLHSAIRDRGTILSSLKNSEQKFRNLQDRIELAGSFSEAGLKTSKKIIEIGKLIPSQAQISSLSFEKKQAVIIIDVLSISTLAETINSLKSYKPKAISIDNIESKKNEAGLSVTITLYLE